MKSIGIGNHSRLAAVGILSLFCHVANADVICDNCEYIDDRGDGTWLGLYDPENFDSGTFQRSVADIGDFWVFDLASEGNVLISAELAEGWPDFYFEAYLFLADDIFQCDPGAPPQRCSVLRDLPSGSIDYDGSTRFWEIDARNLAAGRYGLYVSDGEGGSGGEGLVYSGQLTAWTDRVPIPAPTSLSLLGLGLLGLAASGRRDRR